MHRPTLVLLAALSGGVAGAQQYTLDTESGGWLREERGRTFCVHPTVLTVRAPLELDVAALLADFEGPLAGARLLRENRLGFRDVLVPEGADVLAYKALLEASGRFELVEENTLGTFLGGTCASSTTPTFADQWNLENTGQTGGTVDADIDAPEAWAIEDGNPAIVVAIVDSGTNGGHEDLVGNMWSNPGETLDGTDTDMNGFVDDLVGWDFEAGDNDPMGIFWHGTATASVVGARGQNGLGIEGVAGGANDGSGVSLMPIKVGNFSPVSDVVDDAILYAVDNGADVINLSLGLGVSGAVTAALDAAEAAGVLVVAASGDDNSNSIHFPASHPPVVAVTSTVHFDFVSNVSNFGEEVDVAAPGELVPVCELGSNAYYLACGSSFAAPHVAGLAGLLLSVKDSLTNDELRTYITEQADDIELPGEDVFSGAGRINAKRALVELSTGFAKAYGVGTHGTGTVPSIAVNDVPTIGQVFEIRTFNALPGAPGGLGFGLQSALIPFLGGFLNIHPTGMSVFPVLIDSQGDGMRSFPLPADTALIARERFLQWFILDAGAPGGLAMSRGMHVRVALN